MYKIKNVTRIIIIAYLCNIILCYLIINDVIYKAKCDIFKFGI